MAVDLDGHLVLWVDEGLITAEQAAAIRQREDAADRLGTHIGPMPAPSEAPPAAGSTGRRPMLAEAIGYVGAVLSVVAGGLVVSDFWDRIVPWGRLLLTATLTVVVFAAGLVLRKRAHPAVQRLVSLLWLATVVGVAFVVGLALSDADVATRDIALAVAVAVAVTSVLLYAVRRTALQLVAMTTGIGAVAITSLARPQAIVDPLFFGLLLWALGVALVLLAMGRWLVPHETATVLGLLAIGIGCQVGAVGDLGEAALLLALASAGVLLWVAVSRDDTVVLAFAVFGVFVFTPQAVFTFFGDSIGAPLALLLTGLLLVGASVGLLTLRRERTEQVPR